MPTQVFDAVAQLADLAAAPDERAARGKALRAGAAAGARACGGVLCDGLLALGVSLAQHSCLLQVFNCLHIRSISKATAASSSSLPH